MNVLHILNTDRFSGAENVVCQIIAMMKDKREIKSVYCSRDGEIRKALAERDIQFAPVSSLSVAEIKRVIREQKPDIIHAHDIRASFVAACACGKLRLISHIHNNAYDSRGVSLKSIAYIFAGGKASHIFWVSESSFDGYAFHSLFREKSSVLYNVLDRNALIQKMNADTKTYDYDVVYVGRLSYPKNPQRLMSVLGKVVHAMPAVKIAVVGTGELEDETKKAASEFGLEANVQFVGFCDNPLKILYNAKVMVMTSRWEGTPMCALEALALGVPIVSTPTDGLNKLVDDGENGYLSNEEEICLYKTISIVRKIIYTYLMKMF